MRINPNNYPLVSVIMNCYNGETYLAEAVKSILDQTYKNFEVIFWDNHSKDKSAVIYKNFKDKRLKYYYATKHTSLYDARNLAIKKSKGKLIGFLDTDDLWTKNKLYLQVLKLKNERIGLVYSNYYFLNQATGLKKIAYKEKLPEGMIYKKLLKDYCVGIGTVLMRKSIFLRYKNFFNKKFNIIGDFDLFIRVSKSFFFASIQVPLLTYRIHNKSYSNNNYHMYIKELKFWLKNQKVSYKNYFFYISEKILYMETILNILNKKYILSLKNIFYISSLKKKIKLFIFLLIPPFILKKLRDNFS
jgi:glycosyltransferase involved in cell wall biosynthesis